MEHGRSIGVGLVAGVAAGAGTYVLASGAELAVWTAVVFAGAAGLLVHARDALVPHVDSWSESRASLLHAASAVAVGLALSRVVAVLDLPLEDAIAVGAFGAGLAVFAYATGIAATLAYLHGSDESYGSDRADGATDD